MSKPREAIVKKITTLKPASVARARLDKRIFKTFADKLDFVYFGKVDQRDEEHQVVHGLTLSRTARDDNFAIGLYHGYDISFVERRDVIKQPGSPNESKHWLIMTADLHTSAELPHVFIGKSNFSTTFYRHIQTKFPHLQKVLFGHSSPIDPGFAEQFWVYSRPTHALVTERVFHPELQKMMLEHFSAFSFEIRSQTLYVYTEINRPSDQLLAKMVQCAAWLASEIDKIK